MIAPLRRRHGRVVVLLAAVLPLVLGFSLAARPERTGVVPAELFREPARPSATPLLFRDGHTLPLELAYWPASGEDDRPPVVEFRLLEDPAVPDLLVYQQEDDRVPSASTLLGPLPGSGTRRFELATVEGRLRGPWLVLWSPVEERVLDAWQLRSE